MRLNKPRIPPLPEEEWTEQQHEVLAPMRARRPIINIYRTLVRAPEALRRFLEWGGYVLSDRNDLTPRQREIVILRVGYLCRSGYEFAQHTRWGLNAGLTPAEIEAIKHPDRDNCLPQEAVLMQAADELVGDHFICDDTWALLSSFYTPKQCMDVVFTAGQYTQVSMFLNTFGVQLDDGASPDPDLVKSS